MTTGCSCICLLLVFRDEPYHGTGDYTVPYGGVPAHHSAWPHPDVQQLQASQQDTRPQRYEMTEYKYLFECKEKHLSCRKYCNLYPRENSNSILSQQISGADLL